MCTLFHYRVFFSIVDCLCFTILFSSLLIRKPFLLLLTIYFCPLGSIFPCSDVYSDYLYAALQMSVQDANMSSDSDMSKVFEDRSFVTSILNSVCTF